MSSIPVTKTFFPPLEEYQIQLQRIWKNQWLTNRGELVIELEEKLKSFLKMDNIIVMNNGTIPLQIALKLLGKRGEIITTPFSYVATSSAIVWENCTPVFVDIDSEYLTIDESKIEAAITEHTTCILATHVFGNPCNIEAIQKLAIKHGLKVIYDAAHCFGVKYNGESIFNCGDVSTCSFHATKIFHTGEGGAIFTKDKQLQHKLFYSHTFGHLGPLDFYGVGINGKISELQAAMGLSVLPYLEKIINERKNIVEFYNVNLNSPSIQRIKIRSNTEWNFSYYPIILENEGQLLNIQVNLSKKNIFPRRYFYPSLNKINYINGKEMPVSESIASRILCLPLFVDLTVLELKTIVSIINDSLI